jgi:hypothetical protein
MFIYAGVYLLVGSLHFWNATNSLYLLHGQPGFGLATDANEITALKCQKVSLNHIDSIAYIWGERGITTRIGQDL